MNPETGRGLVNRISAALPLAALVCVWLVLADSRSLSPDIMGRYSVRLFAFLAASGILLTASAAAIILRPRWLGNRLQSFFAGVSRRGVLTEIWAYGFPAAAGLFLWLGDKATPLARERGMILALVLGYAGILLGIMSAADGARRKKALLRGWNLLFSTLLTLVLLEIGLRIVMPGSIFHPALDLRPHVRVRLRNTDPSGTPIDGWFTTNKWGMRGEEPPRDWDDWFTIICIGGSTTQCFELDDSQAWPQLLQDHLRTVNPETWVGNGGLAGHSSRAHLIFMRSVIERVRPDMVVILMGANEKVNYDLGSLEDIEAIGVTETSLGYRIFCRSRLVQILYYFKKAWVDDIPVQNTAGASRLTLVPMSGQEMDIPEDLHDLLKDPGFTRNNVRQIIALAREYGVTPVFMTQPLLFEDTPYWRGILGKESTSPDHPGLISAASWSRLQDTNNRDIMQVCREEGVACYDLAAAVPKQPEYFFDDMHFSILGSATVADSLAKFLMESGLVPSPAD